MNSFIISLGQGPDNTYFALHENHPYFCLNAKTEKAAVNQARKALAVYEEYASRPRVAAASKKREVTFIQFRGRPVDLDTAVYT